MGGSCSRADLGPPDAEKSHPLVSLTAAGCGLQGPHMLQWDAKGSRALTAGAPVGETTVLLGSGTVWAAQAGT